jgi:acyl-CoA dehydrogenase
MRHPASIPLFASSMRMFLDDSATALEARLRNALETPLGDTAGDAARSMGERGLYSLVTPDASGQVSVRSLCLAREYLGYLSPLADSIFAVQGLGSYAISLTANFEGREALLREVANGKRISAFALTEPDAGSDVASMRTTARAERHGYVLNGEKIYISNVGIADHYLVFANADPNMGKKGISCFLVEKDAPGLALHAIPLSGHHPLGRVRLRDVHVAKKALVGEVGFGLRLAYGTLDVFRTSVGAAACGMARRALDEAVAHVKARTQFGKRLADFQLTQATLAEMATELDASRLLVYRAAMVKDARERGQCEVAMAKMYATEAAQRIIDAAVQLHGGSGVVLGSPVEELYREIRPLRIYEGTTEIQKLIIGGALVTDAAGAAT